MSGVCVGGGGTLCFVSSVLEVQENEKCMWCGKGEGGGEEKLASLYSTPLTGFTSSMTQLRDLENKHHEKVTEIALSLLEQLTKGQLQVDIPDDLKSVSCYNNNNIGKEGGGL